jgi:pyruvate/2-oxoglutarate dehydrogenase complex dihydrolipoamide dehydrogenase (E3) component
MTAVESFDAIILGTGQAGKPLTGALASAGWRVAIVERDRVGGTCVISGCTPTKTMVASARVAHLARRGADYGVNTGPVSVDQSVVRRRKRSIVDAWSAGSQKGLERHPTVELIFGEGAFQGPGEIQVQTAEGTTRILTAQHIFVNVGTRSLTPDIPGLQETGFLDSTSIMELDETPEHLVIIGGGFIGLEFGQMFRRFGARVTILDAATRLIPREDEDIAEQLLAILREDGIHFELGVEVESVGQEGDGAVVRWKSKDGEQVQVRGSHVMVAAGRVPATDALGTEAAGLDLTERGFIQVNDRLETSVQGIWALGDVNGGPPFTHIAYDDFRVVKENLLGEGHASRAGRMVPYTLFTDPQLGRVGLTETEARGRGMDIRVARLPMSRVARAIEMDETRGMMKAVVDAATDRILGVAILGVEGGEIMSVLQVAMMGDLPYTAIRDGVFAHPTLAESLNNLFMALDAG